MTTTTARRTREARALTVLLALIAAVGVTTTLVPGTGHAFTIVALVLAGLALIAGAARLIARLVRERREDREDARTAARWRAQHAPHLVDGARVTGAGVA